MQWSKDVLEDHYFEPVWPIEKYSIINGEFIKIVIYWPIFTKYYSHYLSLHLWALGLCLMSCGWDMFLHFVRHLLHLHYLLSHTLFNCTYKYLMFEGELFFLSNFFISFSLPIYASLYVFHLTLDIINLALCANGSWNFSFR